MQEQSGLNKKDMKMCIIVPSYNAATTLSSLLEALVSLYPCVVIVDDGSEDETALIARDFHRHGVVLLQHPVNRGKGAALRTGFNWAIEQGFEAVITLDSDLQHSHDDLPGLLNIFNRDHLDLLIGTRLLTIKEMPRIRRIGNRFSSWIASRFCHQPIYDSQCGYRIYRLTTCKSILQALTLERFDAETEVIIRIAFDRLRIGFAPITVIYPTDEMHKTYYRPFWDTNLIFQFYVKEFCKRRFTHLGREDTKKLKKHIKYLQYDPGISFEEN